MKFFSILFLCIFSISAHAQSSTQSAVKYKGDFGLICEAKFPTIILYSPKNNEMVIGQRATTPFYRTDEMAKGSVKTNKDFIEFKTYSETGSPTKYVIDRSKLTVFISYYNSVIKKDDNYTLYCQVMPDDDFIETLNYDISKHPQSSPQPSTPRAPNKI